MEELLLEESQVGTAHEAGPNSEKKTPKKSRKAKKKKPKKPSLDTSSVLKSTKAPSSHTDCSDILDDLDEEIEVDGRVDNDHFSTDETVDVERLEEPEPEACEEVDSKKSASNNGQGQVLSVLNPNAATFHPQTNSSPTPKPAIRKRKLDKYIIRVPAEEIDDSEDPCTDFGLRCSSSYPDEQEISDADPDLARWTKQRRFEDDTHLEWQLQQVYASTSALFGWDFTQQQELPDSVSPGDLPWNNSTFWRTAPQDVVRYFSPGFDEPFAGHLIAAPPPPSLYYFNPPPFPFYPTTPSFAPEGPLPPAAFAYHGPVVSSPDFSSGPPPTAEAAEAVD